MQNTPTKTKGKFKKGSSGNPAGRPPGSRNKSTLACEQLLEGNAEQLTQKAVEMAMEGNIQALRLCLERIVPPRKERCINLESRPFESGKDLPIQVEDIMLAITEGRITPGEGESMCNILTSHAHIIEVAEFDCRLAALEANREDVKAYQAELDNFVESGGIGDPWCLQKK